MHKASAVVHPKPTSHPPVQIAVGGEAFHTLAAGIGCNTPLTNQGDLPHPGQRRAWAALIRRLDELRPAWMRIGLLPNRSDGLWHARRGWNLRHRSFTTLVALARWAKKRDCALMLDPFTLPGTERTDAGSSGFWMEPADYAVRVIAPLLALVRRERLTAVRWLGLFNELVWGPGKQGVEAIPRFLAYHRAVHALLREQGFVPGELDLVGPGNLNLWEWPVADFAALGLDPDPWWGAWDQHLYLYHFDWVLENHPEFMRLHDLCERHLRLYARFCRLRGKPLLVSECGNFHSGRLFWGERDFSGPASHISLLADAELVVRGTNEGVDGFARWALCVRPDYDGRWSLVERSGSAMQPSPHAFPMYRLLMRALRPGDRVLPTTSNVAEGMMRYVFGCAVLARDGGARLLLVNDHPVRNHDVALALPSAFRGRRLRRTVVDELRRGEEREAVAVDRRGNASVVVSPQSLTLLETV